MRINVSVIIVNYNTKNMTSDCISSVIEHTKGLNFEIILVDNASTDGSKELFSKDKRIRYIYKNENLGFGKANNIGMEIARGEYFFLLNSDTLLVNNAIKLFYEYAEKKDKLAFYGTWLEDQKGQHISSGGKLPTISFLINELCKSYIPGRYEGDETVFFCSQDCYRIGYITGADLFLHRKVYEITGGFDPVFFMYYEETDWQRSAAKHGIFSYIINGPRIIHLEGGSQKISAGRINLGKLERLTKSKNIYIKKDNNILLYVLYRIITSILYIPKFLVRIPRNNIEAIKAIWIIIKG